MAFSAVPVAGQKSSLAAGLLAFFFGHLGVHGFYLGNTNMGLAFRLTSACSFGVLMMGVATAAVGGLGLVLLSTCISVAEWVVQLLQAIVYWSASDYDFHQKYVVEKRWI